MGAISVIGMWPTFMRVTSTPFNSLASRAAKSRARFACEDPSAATRMRILICLLPRGRAATGQDMPGAGPRFIHSLPVWACDRRSGPDPIAWTKRCPNRYPAASTREYAERSENELREKSVVRGGDWPISVSRTPHISASDAAWFEDLRGGLSDT